jgi:N4-gp56 family major capsid protein
MAFTTNLTGTAQVDDSIVLAFDKGVMIANGEAQKLEGFVDTNVDIGAKSIAFTKYSRLALATTPLTETDDVVSAALSDSEILLTPKEYGNAVTTTALASFQTGGKVNVAAARLVGLNMGMTQDQLIINSYIDHYLTNAPSDVPQAVMSGATLDAQYATLVTRSATPIAGDLFVCVASEADIGLIRNSADFQDVSKYANAMSLLRNEVGIYKGHRIVRHQGVPAGTFMCFGSNVLGKAVSKAPGTVVTNGADKLGRFVHVGWHGIFTYGVIDADAGILVQA